jgi:hypothetical protein
MNHDTQNVDMLGTDPFLNPCASVTSLSAVCNCVWNQVQSLKSNPTQFNQICENMAHCVCDVTSATQSECVTKWTGRIKAIFSGP